MTSTDVSTLSDLRVAVTGGTSGLGLALVQTLHDRGAVVAFVARQGERVSEVTREFEGTHGIQGDVSLQDDTDPIAMQISAALGWMLKPVTAQTILDHQSIFVGCLPERPGQLVWLHALLCHNSPIKETKSELNASGGC